MCGCSQTKTCRYLDHCYCERRFTALLNRRVPLKDIVLCGAWIKPHSSAEHQKRVGFGWYICIHNDIVDAQMSEGLASCKGNPKSTLTFMLFVL